MTNQELAKIFREMAILHEMQEVAFKPRAFERAAEDIANLEDDIAAVYKKGGLKALEDIPAVGKGIAERIEEYLRTGRINDYEKLKKKVPVKLEELTRVEGVGAKTVKKLYDKLGVKSLADLEHAARLGKIRGLAGFGKKSEERILESIEFLKSSGNRHVLVFTLPAIREIEAALKKHKTVEQIAVAGSVRRRQETLGGVDVLITSKKPKEVMGFFVKLPMVASVLAKGPTKTMVRLKNGLEMDL